MPRCSSNVLKISQHIGKQHCLSPEEISEYVTLAKTITPKKVMKVEDDEVAQPRSQVVAIGRFIDIYYLLFIVFYFIYTVFQGPERMLEVQGVSLSILVWGY